MKAKYFALLAIVASFSLASASEKISKEAVDYHACHSFDPVEAYLANFDRLAKSEQWAEIIAQGSKALEVAKESQRVAAEAKISAQLTSTAFYMGNFDQALLYANRCHQLSESFEDPSLFLRSLYLESAIYRALAGKELE